MNLVQLWKTIYQSKENKIGEIWKEDNITTYRNEMQEAIENNTMILYQTGNNRPMHFHGSLQEHIDLGFNLNLAEITPMGEVNITTDDVKNQIERMKINKAP